MPQRPSRAGIARVHALTIATSVVAAALAVAPSAATAGAPASALAAAAADGPYATLLFSRTEMTAADNCVPTNAGIARLDTVVAPYLASLGMAGTGTLVTDRTQEGAQTCTHSNSSLTASWANATSLSDQYRWSFTSHTATYPSSLAALTGAQSRAETCGSATTIDNHGLSGGHGMISYPGAQPIPVALQTSYASTCFAWGRQYGSKGTTLAAEGLTSPYWQHTIVPNGGPCNESTAACFTIPATGSKRYVLPSKLIGFVRQLRPGQWFTVQAFLLVTGRSPAYSTSPIRWDCTAQQARLHWSNDNERYCYKDWQAIVRAIAAVPGVVVTDPLTVGVAFGRPATYP